MSKQELKKYKMEKLRLKFRTVAKQINDLKNEKSSDYKELTN